MAEAVRKGPPPGFGSDPIYEQMRQGVQRDLAWETVSRLRAVGWRLTLWDEGNGWSARFRFASIHGIATKLHDGATPEEAILAAAKETEA